MFIQCSHLDDEQLGRLQAEVIDAGFKETIVVKGSEITVINCIGALSREQKLSLAEYFRSKSGVLKVEIAATPFRLTARSAHPEEFTVKLNGIAIGGKQPIVVIAGPCAVESHAQITGVASKLKAAGAKALRGGAYKPRKSPHSFQGLGEEGLQYLASARELTGLPVVTEVKSPDKVALVASYADVLQIGANNMSNSDLLEAVGQVDKPVILKRNPAADVDAWLLAAEYIVRSGNDRVVLCARGVAGIANGYTRYNCDIDVIPVVKGLTHHPVIYDPSHNAGNRDLVPDLAKAAIAAGADGLLIEVHPDPNNAKCDGDQSLYPERFASLMDELRAVAQAIGRSL